MGQRGEIRFSQVFGTEPKFRRAVHKVAFGALAYFLGADEALRDVYTRYTSIHLKVYHKKRRKSAMLLPVHLVHLNHG